VIGFTESDDVFFGFTGVMPIHLHVEVFAIVIEFERFYDRAGDALESVHAGAGSEPVSEGVPFEDAGHGSGIGVTPGESETGEQASGLLDADHFDEVFAHLSESVDVMQDESSAFEVDSAGGEIEYFFEMDIFGFHVNSFIMQVICIIMQYLYKNARLK